MEEYYLFNSDTPLFVIPEEVFNEPDLTSFSFFRPRTESDEFSLSVESIPVIRRKICVFGFYGKGNLGDEMFKETIPLLFPSYQVEFYSTDSRKNDLEDYSLVICGGGDIFNGYFLENFAYSIRDYKGPVYALGIGIPERNFLFRGFTRLFDRFYLRERKTVEMVEKIIEQTGYVSSIPDLGFLLPDLPSNQLGIENGGNPYLACCPATPMIPSKDYFEKMKKLIDIYYRITGLPIIMIRFNVSGNPSEDDRLVCQKLQEEINQPWLIYDERELTVPEMINFLGQASFSICSRFHAHVFSIVAGCPFVSCSTTQKVGIILKDNHLEATITVKEKECYDLWKAREDTRILLGQIRQSNRSLLKELELEDEIRDSKTYIFRPRNSLFDQLFEKKKKIREKYLSVIAPGSKDGVEGKAISQTSAEIVARFLCQELTGNEESNYLWGTIDNIVAGKTDIEKMIDWIVEDKHKSILA